MMPRRQLWDDWRLSQQLLGVKWLLRAMPGKWSRYRHRYIDPFFCLPPPIYPISIAIAIHSRCTRGLLRECHCHCYLRTTKMVKIRAETEQFSIARSGWSGSHDLRVGRLGRRLSVSAGIEGHSIPLRACFSIEYFLGLMSGSATSPVTIPQCSKSIHRMERGKRKDHGIYQSNPLPGTDMNYRRACTLQDVYPA